MKLEVFLDLLKIMEKHTSPDTGLTTREIALKLGQKGLGASTQPPAAAMRNAQLYVHELSEAIGILPPLLKPGYASKDLASNLPGAQEKTKSRPVMRWYLQRESLVQAFMFEEASLNLLLTGRLLQQALGSIEELRIDELTTLTKSVLGKKKSSEFNAIAQSLRLLPDGIGRMPAKIEPGMVKKIIEAIRVHRAVSFEYQAANQTKGRRTVNPLGLVSKDGTIYLLGSRGFEPKVITYALQRASDLLVEYNHARQVPENFNLDNFIENSQQFSHPTGADIELWLEVAPETIHHFRERPFNDKQSITKSQVHDGWYTVKATILDMHALVPFLMSMLSHIKVMGPASVRDQLAEHIRKMHAHYNSI